MKLYELENRYESLFENTVTVNGWVLTTRSQKNLTFIKITDGTTPNGVQLIVDSSIGVDTSNLSTGASVNVKGKLVRSPAEGQPYEILVTELTLLGSAPPQEYPLSKGKLPLDYLRNHVHLRNRTQTFGSVFRIKSAISHATHDFFREQKYLHVNPNIITINECEGGAGVFQITEHDMSDHKNLPVQKGTTKHDWSIDHFDKPAYLTVSSQLQLEALCCSLGAVYTTNKSFRSEHSLTNKHLSEFEHLEIEEAFIDLSQLMDIGENYIKYVGNYLLTNAKNDIDNLGKFVSKGLKERIETITTSTFTRIRYDDAIELLKKSDKLSKPVVYGDDLCSEFENYLTEHFNGPVFVSHWPIAIKSFYMKQCENNLCENFDLLMPYKVGELIGGSMREDDLGKLLDIMKQKGVSPEPLQFYLDLRKFGTVPHGGFGLGFDRLCMMFTGMESIKDVVAFPVHYKNCSY